MTQETAHELRADARLNRDRLLEAAARAFARDGTHASLKAIAKDAGVGIGTSTGASRPVSSSSRPSTAARSPGSAGAPIP